MTELWADGHLQVYDFAKDKPNLVSWLSDALQSKFAFQRKQTQSADRGAGKKGMRGSRWLFKDWQHKWHQGPAFYTETREENSAAWLQSTVFEANFSEEERSENRKQMSIIRQWVIKFIHFCSDHLNRNWNFNQVSFWLEKWNIKSLNSRKGRLRMWKINGFWCDLAVFFAH